MKIANEFAHKLNCGDTIKPIPFNEKTFIIITQVTAVASKSSAKRAANDHLSHFNVIYD